MFRYCCDARVTSRCRSFGMPLRENYSSRNFVNTSSSPFMSVMVRLLFCNGGICFCQNLQSTLETIQMGPSCDISSLKRFSHC